MPICQWGSEKSPSAPDQFEFLEADALAYLTALLPGPLSFITGITLSALGLPFGPQDTDDFCAVEPTGELPTPQDISNFWFPPNLWLTGGLGRLGNAIRLQKWTELAICKAEPAITEEPNLSKPWHRYAVLNFSCSGEGATIVDQVQLLPDKHWRFRVIDIDPQEAHSIELGFTQSAGEIPAEWVGENFPFGYHESLWWVDPTEYGWQSQEEPGTGGIGHWETGPSGPSWWAVLGCLSTPSQTWPMTGSVEVAWFDPLVGAAPPAAPDPPAQPGCPEITSLQDLGDYLCAMNDKIQHLEAMLEWLTSVTSAPGVNPSDEDYDLTGSGELEKPPNAIGATVTVHAPAHVARYGANPGVQFMAGHVSIGTPTGWLPSVQLKHPQQVVWPIPPQATKLGLDLKPGVTATIKWLLAPK